MESRVGVPVPIMAPSMLRALLQSARDLDVLVAHGHVYIGTLYAALAARLAPIPLVIVQHNPFVEYRNSRLNRLEAIADRTVGRSVLERASEIIAVSDFTKAFVESVAPGCCAIRIYPGVNLDRFILPSATVPNQRPLFLTVRRLVERNGLDVLIRAWTRGDLGEYADLAVVGDGPLRHDLMELSRSDPSVRFLGRVTDEELVRLYHGADVFVLPTVSGEGYGLALAEALASGLPVIATDDGGARELVIDGVTGVTVPPGDADALAGALKVLASDSVLRAKFTSNVRTRISGLDRRQSHLRFERVLRSVLRPTNAFKVTASIDRHAVAARDAAFGDAGCLDALQGQG